MKAVERVNNDHYLPIQFHQQWPMLRLQHDNLLVFIDILTKSLLSAFYDFQCYGPGQLI